MNKIRKLGILALIMIVVSFQGNTQEVSTVILSGWTYQLGVVTIEIVKPDYSVEIREYGRKDEKNLLVEIKRELDYWINEGYSIHQTNSNSGSTNIDFRYTYILIKQDD